MPRGRAAEHHPRRVRVGVAPRRLGASLGRILGRCRFCCGTTAIRRLVWDLHPEAGTSSPGA